MPTNSRVSLIYTKWYENKGQSRDTRHTKQRTKAEKTQKHNTTQKTKKMSNMNPTKKPGKVM